ncbi:MAG TPA: MFS transporter [Burkholderiales bacterium]|nr:MFS transporter [Burkholderiales bacterium]
MPEPRISTDRVRLISSDFKFPKGIRRSRLVERSPVFYGWIILLVGTLGIMMTTPGQTVGVAVFVDSLVEDLGVSRASVSLMYTLGTLAGALVLPLAGRLLDRHGPRVGIVVIASLFALSCVWMGTVTNLLTLFIGFMLIRSLGQGALMLASQHVINVWFVRRRGFAIGLSGVGFAAATAFAPMLIGQLIDAVGWRFAYGVLGAIVALTILPLGALLFREHPERYGLRPDGRAPDRDEQEVAERRFTLVRARRTRTFWLFVAAASCTSALGTGLIFHHFSIMEVNGISRSAASSMFVTFGFVLAGAGFLTGMLMDRVQPTFLLSGSMTFLVAALLMAPQVAGANMLLGYGVLLGLMQGVQGAISATAHPYYFGRRHIGSIRGFVASVGIASAAVGPLLFAVGHSVFGDYTKVLMLSAVLPIAIAAAVPFVRAESSRLAAGRPGETQ